MRICINGNVNKYYVQTLCMIFFPGEKFSEKDGDGSILELSICEHADGVFSDAKFTLPDKTVRGRGDVAFEEGVSRAMTVKISVGTAVFAAGEKLFRRTPPWGILTGVRPTKIAMELLSKKVTQADTKKILSKRYLINHKKAILLTSVAATERRIIRSLGERTCSVYISIPFCPSRCSYCSFVSYSTKRLLSLIPEYLDRLIRDIVRAFRQINELGLKVTCVYIGGGTPTILSAEQLDRLLGTIFTQTDVTALSEYTLEAGRPDTITPEKLACAVSRGIGRISINTQTLNNSVLETIGRRHTADDFYRAFGQARESGIKTINTDLIAALPGESFASFAKSVDTVIKLRPENLTFHTFCVKKASDILRDGSDVYSLGGSETGKSVDYAQVSAKNAGYFPYYLYRQKNTVGNYENVGYSLEGHEGLYNIYMMEEVQSIFAIGAGAVTKLVPGEKGEKIERLFMPKYPYEYLSMDENGKEMKEYYSKIKSFFGVDNT